MIKILRIYFLQSHENINYLEKIQNVDFDWNSNIRFKVNSKVSGNFIIHLLYDDDLLSDLQVRELLGLGINIDL